MLMHLKKRLRAFTGEERGYVSIESIILVPVLIWIFLAMWVYFDVFRQQSVNQKAAFTIGDMLSRETDYVTPGYVDNSHGLLNLMTKSYQGDETALRITVAVYDANQDRYKVRWSQTRGWVTPLANNTIGQMANRLPMMVHNEEVILVETWEDYRPAFQVGLPRMDLKGYSFTKPRFAPQLKYDPNGANNGNNGWGNGDQDAPGYSLCNNNAENAEEGAADPTCI